MADQPSSDDISTVASITSLSDFQASQFLKRYGSVQTAVNKFFDHGPELPPESTQWGGEDNTWEEGHFHGDKSGQYGPETFQVHSQDTLNPTVFGNPVSRPPSRVSYTGSNAANRQHLSDEEQMQQAISMSMDPAQNAQESGVIDASGTQFRPARQDYQYDSGQWGLTIAGSQQIFPNPEPEFRKRQPGAPAFMKPTPADHYLPALLTILHAVPMAKEALLSRGYDLGDYGRDDEWWNGTPIEVPRVVSFDQLDSYRNDNILYESQRIMAFLEMTDRAYGSTGALSHQANIPDQVDLPQCPEGLYLESWQAAADTYLPNFPLLKTFQTDCVNQNLSSPNGEPEVHTAGVIRTEIPRKAGEKMTLYDAIDNALWSPYSLDEQDEIYLEFGEVLVFLLEATGSESSVGAKVPPVWYGDRYLKESTSAARNMRAAKAQLSAKIKKIDETQKKLTEIQYPQDSAKRLDASQLLEVAKPFFNRTGTGASNSHNNLDIDSTRDTDQETGPPSSIVEELQAVAARVTKKFKALEELKDQTLQQMRELSNLYTKPAEDGGQPPHHRFTLRGVATDSSTTYVLANPNTVEDLIDTNQSDWQWWKIGYTSGDASPVDCSKVTEIEVIHAAKNAPRKALLVYASDNAMSYENQKLSSPLRNFVRADNLALAKELEGHHMPTSPASKRKADDSDGNEPNWGGINPPNSPPAYSHQPPTSPPPVPPRQTAASLASNQQLTWNAHETLDIHIEDADQADGYQDVDLLGDFESQEMQERKGKLGAVPGGTGPGVGEYALGSYAPELCMQDVEEMEAEETAGK